MTTSRKLEDIATNLDDMSLTLEEIKEEAVSGDALDKEKLDQIQAEIARATTVIEASLERLPPEE